MVKYYTQPLNLYALINGKEFLCPQKCENKKFPKAGYCPVCEKKLVETIMTCSLEDSIKQRIHLILISNLSEFRCHKEFGNKMWDHDFENIPNEQFASVDKWKTEMAASIRETILRFESRLFNVKTTLALTEEELRGSGKENLRKIKKRVEINIQGNIKKTNEPFFLQEFLYVSPLWVD